LEIRGPPTRHPSSPPSIIAFAAVRNRDDEVSLVTTCCWRAWWGGLQCQDWPQEGSWGNHDSRSFSFPSGASVVWWIRGKRRNLTTKFKM
jgi:hypothetical protein